MYVLYTDDSIIAGPDENEINQAIKDIQDAGLHITVEGDLQDFLGINIERKEDGTIHLTQPHLIDQIIKDLRLDVDNNSRKTEKKLKNTPAPSSRLLTKHSKSPKFDNHFHYRSVIRKYNYSEKGNRSDIGYEVPQCDRF